MVKILPTILNWNLIQILVSKNSNSKERVNYNKITPILLNWALPFVNDLTHLGNVLQSDNSMTIVWNKQLAIFI